jgi:hypothetical protein
VPVLIGAHRVSVRREAGVPVLIGSRRRLTDRGYHPAGAPQAAAPPPPPPQRHPPPGGGGAVPADVWEEAAALAAVVAPRPVSQPPAPASRAGPARASGGLPNAGEAGASAAREDSESGPRTSKRFFRENAV